MRSFFAIIIAGGVCFLPALYAWMNIYSNLDPYGSTGNLKVAVISLDEGYTDESGETVNAGDKLVDQLHENDAIDWQFVKSKKKAVSGVRSGKYYAAIVVPRKFTYNMYNVFSEEVNRPQLLFYQNQKKNAIASKITDTVVGNLQNSLNEAFVSLLTEKVFAEANDLAEELQDETKMNEFIDKLHEARDGIDSINEVLGAMQYGNSILETALTTAATDSDTLGTSAGNVAGDITESKYTIQTARGILTDYNTLMNSATSDASTLLSNLQTALTEAKVSGDIKSIEDTAKAGVSDIETLDTEIKALKDAAITDVTGVDVEAIRESYDSMTQSSIKAKNILDTLQSIDVGGEGFSTKRQQALTDVETALSEVNNISTQYNDNFMPQIANSLSGVENILDDTSDSMSLLGQTLIGMGNVFESLNVSLASADESITQTTTMLELLGARLDTIITKVDNAKESEKLDVLIDTLSANPVTSGEFFSEPVKINTSAIYPVKDYGSAVTPFYTVLAIWVGALILTAIIHSAPEPGIYPEAKDYEIFFGRFLIFALFSQIQTAIIVWGDICLFHVQCKERFYFWLASAFAGFTFMILIYALVSAFGDVGKAMAVVIVVLQIAGSSGTYPIELLPDFFQKVYIFFPFPYAINALRECVGGMFHNDYWMYLNELFVFVIVAVVIGIWGKRAFKNIGEYMEKRMEDTEMM